MIISHTHKFIFLCNGKTGTTSIRAALADYHEEDAYEVGVPGLYENKHVPPSVLRGMLGPSIWEDYFTFCFVRNPWDWFVSQFFWNQDPNPISKKKLLRRPLETTREYLDKRRKRRYLKKLETFSPDEIYETYELLKQYRGVHQADSLFQYHYVYAPDGTRLVDYVGRFENIGTEFQNIIDRIGVEAELAHRNATSHRDYTSYYTPETKDIVADLYSIDIETFGYAF